MEISSTQPAALRNICNFGLYELHCSVNLSDVNQSIVPSADPER
jgi:hypothetical protein